MPSVAPHLRRRAGTTQSRMQARAELPAAYQGTPFCWGCARALVDPADVPMVRAAVPGAVPVIVTRLVDPKLRTGMFCALAGLDAIVASSTTVPVKPPLGVTVMVEVFPAVAPGVTLTGVAEMAKPGGIVFAVTVTETLAETTAA